MALHLSRPIPRAMKHCELMHGLRNKSSETFLPRKPDPSHLRRPRSVGLTLVVCDVGSL